MTVSQSSVGHLEQQVVAGDAGVVDQHRRRAELLGDPVDRGLHGLLVGDVDAHGERAATGGLDLGDDRAAGGLVEVEDRDGEPVRLSRRAMAAPMPRAAPVTMAVRVVWSFTCSPRAGRVYVGRVDGRTGGPGP